VRERLQQAAAVEAATHFAPVARPRLSTTVDRLNFGSLKTPEKRWSISTLDFACGPHRVSANREAFYALSQVAPSGTAQTVGCYAQLQTAGPHAPQP
jgi:hypothetical protein